MLCDQLLFALFNHASQVFLPFSQFNHNKIDDWKDIEHLVPLANLQTVYFEHNPIYSDPQYRRKLKLTLPTLTQIDATMIR